MEIINSIDLKDLNVTYGSLKAYSFEYNTGVRGIKLVNNRGSIVVLPFNGQQIWSARFDGRDLQMKSMFSEPKDVDFFLETYGCFFMHCGAWRMGCPGPEDDHPLHGELPYAKYRDASIVFGENDKGKFIGVTGLYYHDLAFSVHYVAKPLVRIYENSGLIDISIEIENRSGYPMELMYMAHVNFRPVNNGEIVQTLRWDPEHMILRKSIPSHVKVSDEFLKFMDRLEKNPELSRIIREEDIYKPEVAFFIKDPIIDEDGYAHFMQIHPDGTSDYIRYKPEEFDHATRWIMKTKDQEALGLALPATCDPEGYTAEKKKGNIKMVDPKSTVSFSLEAGLLNSEETGRIKRYIEKLIK